jgi:hypothetical protein
MLHHKQRCVLENQKNFPRKQKTIRVSKTGMQIILDFILRKKEDIKEDNI